MYAEAIKTRKLLAPIAQHAQHDDSKVHSGRAYIFINGERLHGIGRVDIVLELRYAHVSSRVRQAPRLHRDFLPRFGPSGIQRSHLFEIRGPLRPIPTLPSCVVQSSCPKLCPAPHGRS